MFATIEEGVEKYKAMLRLRKKQITALSKNGVKLQEYFHRGMEIVLGLTAEDVRAIKNEIEKEG